VSDEWRFTPPEQHQIAKVRIARLAARQFGVVARRQLTLLDVSPGSITWWQDAGYLFRLLLGVYAVGYAGHSTEATRAAPLLYAGPGAMLSHRLGTWWLGFSSRRPLRSRSRRRDASPRCPASSFTGAGTCRACGTTTSR
jgi:hypothetical protein